LNKEHHKALLDTVVDDSGRYLSLICNISGNGNIVHIRLEKYDRLRLKVLFNDKDSFSEKGMCDVVHVLNHVHYFTLFTFALRSQQPLLLGTSSYIPDCEFEGIFLLTCLAFGHLIIVIITTCGRRLTTKLI